MPHLTLLEPAVVHRVALADVDRWFSMHRKVPFIPHYLRTPTGSPPPQIGVCHVADSEHVRWNRTLLEHLFFDMHQHNLRGGNCLFDCKCVIKNAHFRLRHGNLRCAGTGSCVETFLQLPPLQRSMMKMMATSFFLRRINIEVQQHNGVLHGKIIRIDSKMRSIKFYIA